MIRCKVCRETSPNDAKFCIGCGRSFNTTVATTGETTRLESSEPIYISHKEADYLFRDTETFVLRDYNHGYDVYYHGRKVIFVDD